MSNGAMSRGEVFEIAGDDERVALSRTLRDARRVHRDRVRARFRRVDRNGFDVVEVISLSVAEKRSARG
jgi:hypothetical protein